MISFRLVHLAYKNMLSSRKKSISAILSVASGFLALNLFQAYIVDSNVLFDQTYENRLMLGHLLVRKESRLDLMSREEQDEVSNFVKLHQPEIQTVVRFLNFSGTLNTGSIQTLFSGYGYDLNEGAEMRRPSWTWNVLAGKPLATDSGSSPVQLGRRLGEVVNCTEDTPLQGMISKKGYKAEVRPFKCENSRMQFSLTTASGQVNAAELNVSGLLDGVFRDIDERLAVTSLKVAQALMHTDEISMMSLRLKDPHQASTLKDDFARTVQKKFPALQLKSWKEFEIGDFYNKSIDFLFVFRNFVTIVVIFIGALSVMTTFYRLVFERTREIGTLLSVGFRPRHVLTLVLSEAFMLSSVGVLIGIVASLFVATLINALQVPYKLGMLSEAVPFGMTMSFDLIAASALTLIAISLFVCSFPVRRALKMKVSDALRE